MTTYKKHRSLNDFSNMLEESINYDSFLKSSSERSKSAMFKDLVIVAARESMAKNNSVQTLLDGLSDFIVDAVIKGCEDAWVTEWIAKINYFQEKEFLEKNLSQKVTLVKKSLNQFKTISDRFNDFDVQNVSRILNFENISHRSYTQVKAKYMFLNVLSEFHNILPTDVLRTLRLDLKDYWMKYSVMIQHSDELYRSFWSRNEKKIVEISIKHINDSQNADIIYTKEYLDFTQSLPFYFGRELLNNVLCAVDFLKITTENKKVHNVNNVVGKLFFASDKFDVHELSAWAYFFRILEVSKEKVSATQVKHIRKIFETYCYKNFKELKDQLKDITDYDMPYLLTLDYSAPLFWTLFFSRDSMGSSFLGSKSEKMNAVFMKSLIAIANNEVSLRIPAHISFYSVSENPLWFVINMKVGNNYSYQDVSNVVIRLIKDNDLILGKYKNSKNRSIYDLAVDANLNNLDVLREIVLETKPPGFFVKLFSLMVPINQLRNELISIPLLQDRSSTASGVIPAKIGLPQFLNELLGEIEEVRKNSEKFIEKYVIDDEDSDFIRNRINIYLEDVISHYKEERLRLDDMKKMESASVERLESELTQETVENLNIIKNQLLIARGKIAKEVIEESSFKRQGMSEYLKIRFPEASANLKEKD